MALDPAPEDAAALAAVLTDLADRTRHLPGPGSQHGHATGNLAVLTALATAVKDTLDGRAGLLDGLPGLDREMAILAARLDPDCLTAATTSGYQPGPQTRFWQLAGQARDDTIARLRSWVEEIYRPGYGHLAAMLGDCWPEHPLCLYTLDWLSELWAVLYLDPGRTPDTLAGQAEWQTRLLAAATDQMTRETTRCPHHRTPISSARPRRTP